jgi:hypothetical protein
MNHKTAISGKSKSREEQKEQLTSTVPRAASSRKRLDAALQHSRKAVSSTNMYESENRQQNSDDEILAIHFSTQSQNELLQYHATNKVDSHNLKPGRRRPRSAKTLLSKAGMDEHATCDDAEVLLNSYTASSGYTTANTASSQRRTPGMAFS